MNQIERLQELKGKFTFNESEFYPGLGNNDNEKELQQLFNEILDEFIKGVQENYDNKMFVHLIAKSLEKFEQYNLDTEDREYVCSSFEDIMDAIDLISSEGVLNKWMYGFEI